MARFSFGGGLAVKHPFSSQGQILASATVIYGQKSLGET
jgi:hypothetical protein